jgi:hypothetical protein
MRPYDETETLRIAAAADEAEKKYQPPKPKTENKFSVVATKKTMTGDMWAGLQQAVRKAQEHCGSTAEDALYKKLIDALAQNGETAQEKYPLLRSMPQWIGRANPSWNYNFSLAAAFTSHQQRELCSVRRFHEKGLFSAEDVFACMVTMLGGSSQDIQDNWNAGAPTLLAGFTWENLLTQPQMAVLFPDTNEGRGRAQQTEFTPRQAYDVCCLLMTGKVAQTAN